MRAFTIAALLGLSFGLLALVGEVAGQPGTSYEISRLKEEVAISDEYVFLLADTTRKLTFAQISGPAFQPKWAALDKVAKKLDPTLVYWVRISLINRLPHDKELILQTGFNDLVDYFILDPDGNLSTQKSGRYVPYSQKTVRQDDGDKAQLWLVRHRATTIYARVVRIDHRSPSVQAKLFAMEYLYQRTATRYWQQGLLQGIFLIFILFNLVLFFSSRQRVYLYYVLFVGCSAYTFLANQNLAKEIYGLREYPQLSNYLFFIGFGLLFPSYLLFLRRFVGASVAMPNFYRFSRWLVGGKVVLTLGVALLIYLSGFNLRYFLVLSWATLLEAVVCLIFTILLLRNRDPLAQWAGRSALIFWIIVLLGLFSYLFATAYGILLIELAVVSQAIGLSLGLGYRIRLSEQEKQHIQGRLIDQLYANQQIEAQAKAELEHRVIERTTEIAQQKEDLAKINALKDKLFSIIAHDLRGPLNALHSSLDLIHQDLINPEDFQMIGQQLSTELEFTRKLVDNLLHWALLQQGGLLVLPSQIQLRAIVQDNIGLLQKTAVEKKIELLNHVSHSAVAYADPNLVNIVVRNLINNALKFTRPNGRVEIKTQESSDCLIVSIADNGVGMTAEQQNKLFAIQTHFSTRGTQLEKGTGLGLIVSKEFVENSYGKIWVESIPDQGATFYFSLPLAPLQMGT